jgi:hypothetical protein
MFEFDISPAANQTGSFRRARPAPFPPAFTAKTLKNQFTVLSS